MSKSQPPNISNQETEDRVLIAEDHSSLAEMYKNYLEEAGYQVFLTAELEKLKKVGNQFDIVLTNEKLLESYNNRSDNLLPLEKIIDPHRKNVPYIENYLDEENHNFSLEQLPSFLNNENSKQPRNKRYSDGGTEIATELYNSKTYVAIITQRHPIDLEDDYGDIPLDIIHKPNCPPQQLPEKLEELIDE